MESGNNNKKAWHKLEIQVIFNSKRLWVLAELLQWRKTVTLKERIKLLPGTGSIHIFMYSQFWTKSEIFLWTVFKINSKNEKSKENNGRNRIRYISASISICIITFQQIFHANQESFQIDIYLTLKTYLIYIYKEGLKWQQCNFVCFSDLLPQTIYSDSQKLFSLED